MARIGIIGAGNTGLYLGAFFHLAGCQVSWVGRQWVLDEIEEAGALTVSDFNNHTFSVPSDELQFLTDVKELVDADANIDFLFLCVKAHATEEIVQQIKHLDGKVVIVTLQNGIHNASVIQKHMPNSKVIRGMLSTNIVHLPGAHFHQATLGPIQLEDGEEASTLAQVFIEAGFATQLTADIEGVLYGKLVMNMMNATNAVSGVPLRTQLEDRAHRSVLAILIEESLAAFSAANLTPLSFFTVPLWLVPRVLRLPNWLFFQIASTFLGIDHRAMSSMYDDLLLKRPTEIDQLNGEIVQIGAANGVQTPANQAIVRLIKAVLENPPAHPPSMSGEELLALVQAKA